MFLLEFVYIIICELLSQVAAYLFDFPLTFITIFPEELSMTSSAHRVPRKSVAIVGTGSAGIGALWALNRTHHDVYVYEAADRLGGHTNTVTWKKGKFQALVDTGFVVLNTATYPNFLNFLKRINVKTVKTEMTFGLSRDHGKFEWAGTGLDAVFCQRENIFSPKMWRLLFDIVRFNQFALDLLRDENAAANNTETIGQYLERKGYSETFKNDYLIPMTAAVWNTSPDKCSLEFPAVALVRFMWNHHLLTTVSKRPDWLTVEGGAKSYIDAVVKGFPPNHLFLDTPVKHITNDKDGRVRLHLENGKSEVYDHVILATHGDQAYQIIEPSATDEERVIMSSFKTSENTAVLHSDATHMPVRKNSWSAWNYMTLSDPWTGRDIDKVSVTYNMNILQHIPREPFGDVLVTLNPIHEPKANTVQGRYSYSNPIYNPVAARAQNELHRIQNKRGISYAGAWTKYGFQEDGFSSGLHVAEAHLGAKLPFEFVDSTYSRGKRPKLGVRDRVARAIIFSIQFLVVSLVEGIVSRFKPKFTRKVNGAWKRRTNGYRRLS
ncbi:amine oxidase [Seiridium cupressi]